MGLIRRRNVFIMRSFEFAKDVETGKQAFGEARLPEYATKYSAGADFFCAKDVVIPSVFNFVVRTVKYWLEHGTLDGLPDNYKIQPVLVHTGIKANMEEDEVLEIYNRSSNPKKLGLILANSVGIIDKDYYSNPDNDGEIMFAFYNVLPFDTKLNCGDKVGQGIFKKYLRPVEGLVVKDEDRVGGFGSTGK